jgi:hypothetical protein
LDSETIWKTIWNFAHDGISGSTPFAQTWFFGQNWQRPFNPILLGGETMKSLCLLLFLAFGSLAQAENPCGVTYEVPISDTSLKPYAVFCLPSYRRDVENGSTVIRFTLPLELTGKPLPMEFDSLAWGGENTSDFWSENYGTMSCTATECKVTDYKNLPIHLDEVAAYLRASGVRDPEFTARLKVATSFSGDPGGVIHLVSGYKMCRNCVIF